MRKNLVMMHLESMSQALFSQYEEEMPTLWRLRRESMAFKRCYAGGSSTFFTLCGVSYGSTAGLDPLVVYDRRFPDPPKFGNARGLFEILGQDFGYGTLYVHASAGDIHPARPIPIPYPAIQPGFDKVLWLGKTTGPDPVLLDAVAGIRAENKPFALYLSCYYDINHAQCDIFDGNPECAGAGPAETERFVMRCVDGAVGIILDLIERLELTDDTVVVTYGDHGLATYNQGIHPPINRGIAAEQIWVPLFIRGGGMGKGVTKQLASLDDLRATVLGALVPEAAAFAADSPFPGIDLAREERKLAFSQSKYALQDGYTATGFPFKSYSVTDGQYRLCVCTLERDKNRGGLTMFLDQSDSGNCSDLLGIFRFDDEGGIIGVDEAALAKFAKNTWFLAYNPANIAALARRYEHLRQALRNYVEEKERLALALAVAPSASANVMPKEAFCLAQADLVRHMNVFLPRKGKGVRWLAEAERPILLVDDGGFAGSVLELLRLCRVEPVGMLTGIDERESARPPELQRYAPESAAKRFPDCIALGCARKAYREKAAAAACRKAGLDYCNFNSDIIGIPLL